MVSQANFLRWSFVILNSKHFYLVDAPWRFFAVSTFTYSNKCHYIILMWIMKICERPAGHRKRMKMMISIIRKKNYIILITRYNMREREQSFCSSLIVLELAQIPSPPTKVYSRGPSASSASANPHSNRMAAITSGETAPPLPAFLAAFELILLLPGFSSLAPQPLYNMTLLGSWETNTAPVACCEVNEIKGHKIAMHKSYNI